MPRKPIADINKFRDQFVRWTLRRASFRWPPRGEAMKAARVDRGKYLCAGCKSIYGNKEVKLDHIEPVVPVQPMRPSSAGGTVAERGIEFDSFVYRMFPASTGFQVLCKECHDVKTAKESSERAESRRAAKARRD